MMKNINTVNPYSKIHNRTRLTVAKMQATKKEEVRLVLLHKLCKYLMANTYTFPVRNVQECNITNWDSCYEYILSIEVWTLKNINQLLLFWANMVQFVIMPSQCQYVNDKCCP